MSLVCQKVFEVKFMKNLNLVDSLNRKNICFCDKAMKIFGLSAF